MSDYFSKLDEIDKWLFDSFGILPGACSSTENLRHTTARMVAEALWPKKDNALTWKDVAKIITIYEAGIDNGDYRRYNDAEWMKEYSQDILRRFNTQREKK